jgi:hypothetical protein
MSIQTTLDALANYCQTNTGTADQWQGNKSTYRWNLGREVVLGVEVNGVVRKLVGTDTAGNNVWAVAGSFKINADGAILRFTGLPRKVQKAIQSTTPIVVDTAILETV